MPPASRASRAPVAVYHTVGAPGKSGSKARRSSEMSLTAPGLDFAAKLRIFQRALKSRVERRDALLELVRGVNATLEPSRIADFVVDRVSTWVPAPSWALVSSDLSGQLTVLAERALSPDVHRTVHAIAKSVMERGQE